LEYDVLTTNSSIVSFICGTLVGTGVGFLLAMFFQTSIIIKFKDEMIDWILSADEEDNKPVLEPVNFTVTHDRMANLAEDLTAETVVYNWTKDPKATRKWEWEDRNQLEVEHDQERNING
jgi:hypothetical protein